MDNFTVGDRCLVHRLESEAGQLLNGLHVTLVKAIIQNGRFRGKFDDGTFKQIKPCNLQIMNGDRANQTKEMCEENAKKEVREENAKKEVQRNQQQNQQQNTGCGSDVCFVCQIGFVMDPEKFAHAICCGKRFHRDCHDMQGSTTTELLKGKCPHCGVKFPKTDKKVVKIVKKWIKTKNKSWARIHLAQYHQYGQFGIKQSHIMAIRLFEQAVQQGNPFAMYELGMMYQNGDGGLKKSPARAFDMWIQAAEQGHIQAMFNVGCMYKDGLGGVDKSYALAREWWTKGADQGDEHAINNLKMDQRSVHQAVPTPRPAPSLCFCATCNKPESPKHILNLCKCHSVSYCDSKCQKVQWKKHRKKHNKLIIKMEAGNVKKTTRSCEVCCVCLKEVPVNVFEKARSLCCGKTWHWECAENDPMHKDIKQRCHQCRSPAVKTNVEAIEKVSEWVKKGEAWAQTSLGSNYNFGTYGVAKSSVMAVMLFEKAIQQGEPSAMYFLAEMYQSGDGVPLSIGKATRLYKSAAEKGHVEAMASLGSRYFKDNIKLIAEGHGDKQSNDLLMEGWKWLAKAVEHGNKKAIMTLQVLDSSLEAENCPTLSEMGKKHLAKQQLDQQLINVLTLAAKTGSVEYMLDLANLYYEGQGRFSDFPLFVKKSNRRARKWYAKAADQGDETAIRMLKVLDEEEGR